MNAWDWCQRLTGEKESFVVITMVSGRGHVPQDPGAKAIVNKDGLLYGTVGGGKVEAKAIQLAQEKIAAGKNLPPELLVWNLQKDVGMTCGGEVTFLFETYCAAAWHIAVFGAGHVAQALVRLLDTLDCEVTCADPRAEWVEKIPDSPRIKKICLAEPKELVKAMPASTFFLSLTQGHSMDTPILEEIFREHPQAKYIGVIGSELKGAKIRQELLARGIPATLLEKLRCPMGLDLGSNQPGEIAVSIVAELLKIRDS